MVEELGLRGVGVRQEVPFPITDKGIHLEIGLRLDLLVEDLLIVEPEVGAAAGAGPSFNSDPS
jgi:hypothetical protein